MKILHICFFLLAFLATPVFAALPGGVYVVDVEKVLASSKASQQGMEHLAEARKALEKGYDDLRKVWDKRPEGERAKSLSEGAQALSRQLNIELQAITQVISAMMLEEIKIWRENNKAALILPKQSVLDAGPEADITDVIIAQMNNKQPKFAPLPVVSVKPLEEDAPQAKSQDKQKQ